MDPAFDSSQIPLKPKPSFGLVVHASIVIALLLAAACSLIGFIWRLSVVVSVPLGSFAGGGLFAAFFVFVAYGEYRAIFRRRHAACIWLATLYAMVGSGLVLGSIFATVSIVFDGIPTGPGINLALVSLLMLILPGAYLLLAAMQMHAWSQRLRYYHLWKPFCRACGYNLRGTIAAGASRCPECGAETPYEMMTRYGSLRGAVEAVHALDGRRHAGVSVRTEMDTLRESRRMPVRPKRVLVLNAIAVVVVGLVVPPALHFAGYGAPTFSPVISVMIWFNWCAFALLGLLLFRAVGQGWTSAAESGAALLFLLAILSAIGGLVAAVLILERRPPSGTAGLIVILIVQSTYFFLVGFQVDRWSRRLRTDEAQTPRCEACGYDLRGTVAAGITRCPECGEAVKAGTLAEAGQNRDIAADADDSA